MSKNVRRLYDQFHPENYKLSITVEPDKMRFSGTVNILGKKTGKPSNRLTFHQKDLKVTRAVLNKIEKGQSREIEVQRINNHAGYF